MILNVVRDVFTEKSTIGKLFVDGVFQCYTLEDVVREYPDTGAGFEIAFEKVQGRTAIPRGQYEVVLVESPKYGKIMPRLLRVPMYQGILIHSGNDDEDTEGCLLVGNKKAKDVIYESRDAYNNLFEILEAADYRQETVLINIQ